MSIIFYVKLFLFKLGLKTVLNFSSNKLNSLLKPIAGVQKSQEKGWQYKSENEDPQFILHQSVVESLLPGAYLVKLRVKASNGSDTAKIYVDYGEGFNEENSVSTIFISNKTAKFYLYLKSKPKAIRIAPLGTPAILFSIEGLAIKKIKLEEFLLEMQNKIKQIEVYCRQNPSVYTQLPIPKPKSPDPDYAKWIIKYEEPEFNNIWKIKADIENFKIKPKISIIMPVYNTPEKFLREAIESVLCQSYTNWELCIADDASTEPHIKEILEEYKAQYPEKIKVVYRKKNGHICEASNSALKLATGDYIAFLDHDDKLSEHALYYVVKEINKNPDAKIIYSDEDKIDIDGNRLDPHFKSDWNLDLLLSQNYIAHFLVIKKEIVDKIGGFRKGTEGAQDHDIVLRASLHCEDKEIIHIPKILYHWRIWKQSTASNPESKTYTEKAGIEVIKNYLKEKGVKGAKVTKGKLPNTYRVIYPIPNPSPLVSIIIPTRDKVELLKNCINSIFEKTDYRNYEIIIIDNNSTEKETLNYLEKIRKKENVKVLKYEKEFNFSAICNYGVKNADGDIILLLNNDTEVINREWLTEMVRHAVRPEIGCVGAKLYYPDGTIQHAGVILGIGGVAGHSHKYFPKDHPGYMSRLFLVQNLSAVTGACLMVRKEVYEEVGGLDEENLKVAFNDVDFCLKVREAGYRNLWTPYAELYHHESKSRGYEDTPEKQERFKKEIEYMKKKWGKKLLRDPYYNPNLTLDREDFSIRD